MKKRLFALVLALVMTTALCACGGGKPTDPAETPTGSTGEKLMGGEITVGIAADLDTSLDPHVSSSSAGTREVLFNIFEGLMKPDTDGNLIPAVAESYSVNETADAYTFTLREGVKFHNGDAVTVGDVVYSLSRAAGLETGEPLVATLAGVAAVEATDDRTVVVTLKAPDTEFIAYTTAAIIPDGTDPADGLIGTGPFKFVSRVPQESIVIEKFADYWGTPAYLDKVTFSVIESAQTMVMSLRSGAIDMAGHLEASQVADLSDLTILEGSMNLVQALYLNNAAAPFNDVRVRQALSYAIDKYAVIDLAADGHGFAVGSSMYPAFGKYFVDDLTDYYTVDTAKAKELLKEAGYENGFTFTITVPSNYTPHVDAAQVIVNLLNQADIGVTAKIEQVEWATWYSDVYKGRQFEATVSGMDASTLTASALLQRFTSTNAKNFIGFDNADYDAAYAAAVATVDTDKQTELFKQCETILTEQAANVYIQDLADFFAMQNDVGGYEFYPLYVMDLSNVYRIG
ncbi:MAG: ABC transporter substrate-binding protein [Lachnospiraceae bacterium]|nr:ABC transporter substrate-binding protein [Lachnospiraceae bacterium]